MVDFTDGLDEIDTFSKPKKIEDSTDNISKTPVKPTYKQSDKSGTPPTWKDSAAAFVKNAAMGLTSQALGTVPIVGKVLQAGDVAAQLLGVASPLAGKFNELSGFIGLPKGTPEQVKHGSETMKSIGEHAPSQIVSKALAELIGDPTKGGDTAGAAGVVSGINPIGIGKKLITEGAKSAGLEAGKSAAVGAGMTWGASGLGGLAANTLDYLNQTVFNNPKYSEKEKEAIAELAAPITGHTAGKLYDLAVKTPKGVKGVFDTAKETTAAGAAEKRIKQVESEATPERAVAEHVLVKNLMKSKGVTEDEALSIVKKASQGAYGDVSKSKLQDVDHRIVDSVKSTVENVVSPFMDESGVKKATSTVNKAVRAFDDINRLVQNKASTESDIGKKEVQLGEQKTARGLSKAPKPPKPFYSPHIEEPLKPVETPEDIRVRQQNSILQGQSIAEGMKEALPKYIEVKNDSDFKHWLKGHDLESLPKDSQDNLTAKYFIKRSIDTYYQKHVEPIKRELMEMSPEIDDPIDFADYVATEAEALASEGRSKNTYNEIHSQITFESDLGKLNTMDGVYGLMTNLEKNTHFANNKGAIGKLKDKIIEVLPKAVQNKVKEFREAYTPFGSDIKTDTPMYKLSVYDPSTSSTVESMADRLRTGAPDEGFNSILMLSKDNPDVAYSVLRGINSKLATANRERGLSGMAEVIRDHIERADALSNTLPNGHPAKKALDSLQLILQASKDASIHEQAIKKAEAEVKMYEEQYKQYEKRKKEAQSQEDKYYREQEKYERDTQLREFKASKLDTDISQTAEGLEILNNQKQAIERQLNGLLNYGGYASESYTTLLSIMGKDPGMLSALKAQPVGAAVPLTHDIAKSLLESEGVAPDLTMQRSLLTALSAVQGADTVIPDLIRHGITSQIAKFRQDGTLDPTATVTAFRQKAPVIRNYLKNLDTLLTTTKGISPEQAIKSRTYLKEVSDTMDVVDNDIVTKAFQRVYSPSEPTNVQGEIRSGTGMSVQKLAHPGLATMQTRLWGAVADAIAHFSHGKDAIDTAIIKKLDDPEFVKSVSKLKDGFSQQRTEDVKKQAEDMFKTKQEPVGKELPPILKNVLRSIFPQSAIMTGFLDGTTKAFLGYTKAAAQASSYRSEKERLGGKFQKNFDKPSESSNPYEPDEGMKTLLNWKE